MKQHDERDTMFARMNLKKGSPQYNEYYKNNSDKLEIDEQLRTLPQMGEEGGAMYHSTNSKIMDATFGFLADLHPFCDTQPTAEKQENLDPEIMTKKLKGLAGFYGAKLVGITKLKKHHYYSHRGRKTENYGDEVNLNHKYAIAFAVEMSQDMIYRGPQMSESIAVTKGYVDTAVIGMILSYFIRSLGYEARNHMDGNYLVVAPMVAVDAGLGQFGRHGLIVTKEYGSRVRLGVVTTDIPLIADEPIDFGMEQFCMECGLCVRTCPGKSIPSGEPVEIDGVKRWKIAPESCYKRWRSLGTDCGICLANCPFSDYVDAGLVELMKESKEARESIINIFKEKYKVRPYIRGDVDWLEE